MPKPIRSLFLLSLPLFMMGCPAGGGLVDELPDGMVQQSYSASVAAEGSPSNISYTVEGLPDGLSADAAGAISGTPATTGRATVMVTAMRGSTEVASAELDLEIRWDTADDGFYTAFYMAEGEWNNMVANGSAPMRHPWVRLSGVGVGALEAGDEETTRLIRVGLFHKGDDGAISSGSNMIRLGANRPPASATDMGDDVLVGDINDFCSFSRPNEDWHHRPCTGGCGDGDGYNPGNTTPGPDDCPWEAYDSGGISTGYGGVRIMPFGDLDGPPELTANGRLTAGWETGWTDFRAECEGVDGAFEDYFMVTIPIWCTAIGCPGA
jgi:hypothetical protein